MAMERLFQLMLEKKASDLFVAVGSPVHLKVNGTSVPINQQIMDNAMIASLLGEILSESDFNQLATYHELNMGFGVQGVGRFRLSAFHQRGSISCVIRFIQNEIPALESLNLPDILSEIIMEKRGLVLLVGATGSGKSTTIASMLDLRNIQRTGHILTLEDPIEYVFKNKKSIVNQREIGTDTDNLHIALKNALRQAPDCILIGEIRDKETMSASIAYAQSGHLCLATLHANNSYHALNRIISFYPIENRPALLSDLSAALRSIVSQRLIKAKSGGRLPAVEVLLNTRHISELIEKGEINEIKEAMEKSLSPGSQTFEQALYRLLTDGLITEDEALANADSPTNLLWLLNNASPADLNRNREPEKRKEQEGASFTEFTLNA
ncbi:MAG: PilT/PilU family type 4a pilus ATPase [Burkholderiaceae bacterium]|jgi:twitching motility protein PilU